MATATAEALFFENEAYTFITAAYAEHFNIMRASDIKRDYSVCCSSVDFLLLNDSLSIMIQCNWEYTRPDISKIHMFAASCDYIVDKTSGQKVVKIYMSKLPTVDDANQALTVKNIKNITKSDGMYLCLLDLKEYIDELLHESAKPHADECSKSLPASIADIDIDDIVSENGSTVSSASASASVKHAGEANSDTASTTTETAPKKSYVGAKAKAAKTKLERKEASLTESQKMQLNSYRAQQQTNMLYLKNDIVNSGVDWAISNNFQNAVEQLRIKDFKKYLKDITDSLCNKYGDDSVIPNFAVINRITNAIIGTMNNLIRTQNNINLILEVPTFDEFSQVNFKPKEKKKTSPKKTTTTPTTEGALITL